jgi:hypothetical protein
MDHASIALSLAAAQVADLSMVSFSLQNVSFQAWLDPIATALVVIAFFSTRRWYIPPSETEKTAYSSERGCTLGLYRVLHSDLDHAALRAVGSGALTVSWVLFLPAAFANLDTDTFVVYLVGASIGTILLIVGIIVDSLGLIDDSLMRNKRVGPCACNSQALGCVFSTHALWHVIAVAGAVSSILAREYGILYATSQA